MKHLWKMIMIACFLQHAQSAWSMSDQILNITFKEDYTQNILTAIDANDPTLIAEYMQELYALPKKEQRSFLEKLNFERINTHIKDHAQHEKKQNSWQIFFSSPIFSSYALTFSLGITSTVLYAPHFYNQDPSTASATSFGMFVGSFLNYAMLCYDYPRSTKADQIKHMITALQKNNGPD